MTKKWDIEIVVGIFLFIGLLCMAYTSIQLGQIDFMGKDYYAIKASFTSVTGLKTETPVEVAGVNIGKVQDIQLEDYNAMVTMLIKKEIKIQEDAIASIKTKGILGEQYIQILPGASDIILEENEVMLDTEPPFDLLSILKNFVVSE